MKMKKVLALVLAGLMTLSLAACGNDTPAPAAKDDSASAVTDAGASDEAAPAEETKDLSGHLTIWSWTNDLAVKSFEFMKKYPNVEVEHVKFETADYTTKVDAALSGGDDSIDIICGEPQMLEAFWDAGYFADLNALGFSDDDAANIYDFVLEVGQDDDGVQRAVGYQTTAAAFHYRRSLAKAIWGTDDPDEIGKKFSSYANIIKAGEEAKAAGYSIFASDSELNYFTGQIAWVKDNKLQISDTRLEYMDLVKELYKGGYTAYAATWTAPWNQAMAGPIDILTEDVMWGDWGTDENGETNLNVWDTENYNAHVANYSAGKTECVAFGLPAWGALTIGSHVTPEDTYGDWALCAGPEYGAGGGTWIGVSSLSKNQELALEFIKFATCDVDHAMWWCTENSQTLCPNELNDGYSAGDCVSNIKAVEQLSDYESELYGGQKVYQFWATQAPGIDYSVVTPYDTEIGNAFGNSVSEYKKDNYTKDEAIAAFKEAVKAAIPELEVE